MSKIIIGIHGLGNKPPKKLLEKWWKSAMLEGLNHVNMPHPFIKFEMIYWADLLYPRPKDQNITDTESPLFIDEPYSEAKNWTEKEINSKRIKIQKFIEEQLEKLLLNEDGTLNFSIVTDKIIQHYFRDLDIYYSSECINNSSVLIREAIRDRLSKALKKHAGKQIFLIAHSMGSIVAYDVLCSEPDKIKVDTLATIGSPLGLPIIKTKLVSETADQTKLAVPENVRNNWYNFSDLEDKVAINFDLADDYFPNKNKVKIKDFQVSNNYETNELRNPHKSFGYLRAPELANQIDQFVVGGRSGISIWLGRMFNKLYLKLFKPKK